MSKSPCEKQAEKCNTNLLILEKRTRNRVSGYTNSRCYPYVVVDNLNRLKYPPEDNALSCDDKVKIKECEVALDTFSKSRM